MTDEQQLSTACPIISSPSSIAKQQEDTFIVHADRHSSSGYSPPTIQEDVSSMLWSMTRQTTPKPGHARRLKSEASTESRSSTRSIEDRLKTQQEDNHQQVRQIQKTLSEEENQQLDEECLQQFIKLNVKLVTDDRVSNNIS